MPSTPSPRLPLFPHVWLPLLAFVMAVLLFELTRLDLWLADALYAVSGSSWALRDAWATKVLIHDGGRLLVALVAGALLFAASASVVVPRLRGWRGALWYLLGSALLSALAVNLLKAVTHVDCPWDLARYGGEYPYVRTFVSTVGGSSHGACFPAGHASAAYAWLGAYYVARECMPRWRGRVLVVILGAGLLFGFGQQLRGAHFLSHDLWTLGICWCVSTVLYLLAFDRKNLQMLDVPAVDADG